MEKRLLILSSEFPPGPGGIGTHAYQMAVQFSRSNWQVKVLTQQDYLDSEKIHSFNKAQPFGIITLIRKDGWIKNLSQRWRQLYQLVQEWQPDLLVVTGDHMVALSAIAQHNKWFSTRSGQKLPWCAIWHGFVPSRTIDRWVSQWAFGQAELVISVSNYSGRKLLEMGANPRKLLVIPNGANEKRYYPDPDARDKFRHRLGLDDAVILLTVGHVSERKGQDIVIRALPEILKRFPNVHYLMAGLPTLQPELEKLAAALQVQEHVHFLGQVEDQTLNAVYNACDIFVLTSRHNQAGQFEGYGIVAVEAALCEKPAVVAGNSGLAEAVQDEATGLVVAENDPQNTAQAILRLLQDAELRIQMGQRARRRAITEQTWQFCMRQYDAAFRSLIADNEESWS